MDLLSSSQKDNIRRVLTRFYANSKKATGKFNVAFSIWDENEDGTISCQHLGKVMRSLGQNPTSRDLKEMMQDVDTDGDGVINFPEFLQLMGQRLRQVDGEEELLEAFKVFDIDGNGFITAEELKQVMSNIGEQMTKEEIDEMIREADTDGDGQINFEEFTNLLM